MPYGIDSVAHSIGLILMCKRSNFKLGAASFLALGMCAFAGRSFAQDEKSGDQKVPISGAQECRVMEAMSGDASAPIKVCRSPGGVWHKVETSIGGGNGGAFKGYISYTGQYSGTTGRVQRTPARVNAGGFRINLGNIETGMVNQREIFGRINVQISADGPNIDGHFYVVGQGINQTINLKGTANASGCSLAEPTGLSSFQGSCNAQVLRGVLKVENRMGWRMEMSIDATMQSRQSSTEAALAAAAERQRQQQEQAERTEQVAKYVEKLTIRANGGDVAAMSELGDAYDDNGNDIADAKKAAYWYSMAAQRGDPRAMLNLGVDYSNGDGVEKNSTIASALFLKCAKLQSKYQGSCAKNIGISYANGEGVERNKKIALYWLRYCARLGDEKCSEIADEVNQAD